MSYRETLTAREWKRVRDLERELDRLHRRFNRVRSPAKQLRDRMSPGGGIGIIDPGEGRLLSDIMRAVSKVLDELEQLEGKPSLESRVVFDETMKRLQEQRREEKKTTVGSRRAQH